MNQANLFGAPITSEKTLTFLTRGWDALPELPFNAMVAIDFETTGLNKRAGARPFGIAIATSEEEWFCRWDTRAMEWTVNQLQGRNVIFAEAKFDIGMALADGVSFEDIGVKPHDVQHCAALLDDRRRMFGLDVLAKDRLGRGKAILPPGTMHELPVTTVAPYARQDARLTYDLWQSYQANIVKEGLGEVLDLEDSLLYCTLSMEDAGTPLNLRKLERWIKEVEEARIARLLEIWRLTGLRVNPTSGPDLLKLRKHLGFMESGHTTGGGKESFTEKILEEYAETSKAFQLTLEARQLASFLSKYLIKYRDAVDSQGVLRYRLHQLRADEGGTITGRYASSNVNIQQVMKPDKQAEVLKQWVLRELFIPEKGAKMLDSDMSQVEYRLFAHYADVPAPHSKRLAEAYRKDPNLDFHKVVQDWTGLNRSYAKNVNFAKLYGAQADKIALMCEVEVHEAEDLINKYDREFPEANRLMRYCEKLARRRGYVKTAMGRRRRYYEGDRFYSALNSVLQGTAAELLKLKLYRLYKERKNLGFLLRAPVHDEILGDALNSKTLQRTKECLKVQELPLKVPVTWATGVGKNWYEAMK